MNITDSQTSVTKFLQILISRNELKQQTPNLGKLKANNVMLVKTEGPGCSCGEATTRNKGSTSIFPKPKKHISFA